MHGTSMPEAPVHEHGNLAAWEHDVRSSVQPLQWTPVDEIAQPAPMQLPGAGRAPVGCPCCGSLPFARAPRVRRPKTQVGSLGNTMSLDLGAAPPIVGPLRVTFEPCPKPRKSSISASMPP